jgi:hypothetical protein
MPISIPLDRDTDKCCNRVTIFVGQVSRYDSRQAGLGGADSNSASHSDIRSPTSHMRA